MNEYGCFGSVLSRDDGRESCKACNHFSDCGEEVERVRLVLVDKWDMSKELTKLDKLIAKSKGQPIVEAMEEITELWDSVEDLTAYEKMRLVYDRCENHRSSRNIERWHGWGLDAQDIRKGENPFRMEVEPLGFIFVEELIKRGKADAKLYSAVARRTDFKPSALVAQTNILISALYASSVLERRDGVYTLRRVT